MKTYGRLVAGYTQWDFTDDQQIVGVYGNHSERGIERLGFITLDTECQAAAPDQAFVEEAEDQEGEGVTEPETETTASTEEEVIYDLDSIERTYESTETPALEEEEGFATNLLAQISVLVGLVGLIVLLVYALCGRPLRQLCGKQDNKVTTKDISRPSTEE